MTDTTREDIRQAAGRDLTQKEIDQLVIEQLAIAVSAFMDNSLASVPDDKLLSTHAALIEAMPRLHLLIRVKPFHCVLAAKGDDGQFTPIYVAGFPRATDAEKARPN